MTSLSFKLSDDFIKTFVDRKPDWGYQDAAGNSLGEITFLRTYSRKKLDGTKEQWWEVCRRVIEGMYSIQKDWSLTNKLPWNAHKAQYSAQEAYTRMFEFKWLPPGRGLWVMGTPLVNQQRNSAALQNCAFKSTADMTKLDPAAPFCFLMEASMLGVGVGFDNKGAKHHFKIYQPRETDEVYVIPDTREGWVESTRLVINSYLKPDQDALKFDYSQIRVAGEPIRTFGGTAAGPDPLIKLHNHIRRIFTERAGDTLNAVDIADIGNLIGVCVVSGNVRRSAELLVGQADDKEFLNLKNSEWFPERNSYDPDSPGWGWMSNNSVEADVSTNLDELAPAIARNGEPGVLWMDITRQYGRLIDPPNNADWRAAGYNPCAEQSLESGECCTLVETFINRHETLDDYKRTLKFAFLYAKTVTLLPTHWPETNAIMQRNRRIGTSMSGIANFVDRHSRVELQRWMDEGYKTVRAYDKTYSEWLGIRESIKVTTVKPSGTVSILAGESPGVHWAPGGEYFNRAIRFSKDDPMVVLFKQAMYRVEPASESPDTTVVVFFPIHSKARRSDKDVKIFEKVDLAALAQAYWSDNSVSVTVTFNAEKEQENVADVLRVFNGRLKTVSFLPQGNTVYQQMPYTEITHDDFTDASMTLFPVDLTPIYEGQALDALGEAYCTTDACEVKIVMNNVEATDEMSGLLASEEELVS